MEQGDYHDNLKFSPWSMVSMAVFCDLILCPRPNLRFTILTRENLHSNPGHGQNGHFWSNLAVIPFAYGKIGFRPLTFDDGRFEILAIILVTITGRRSFDKKILVALPPPFKFDISKIMFS